MQTLRELSDDLGAGRVTSRELVERCLAAAEDPRGEGKRVFVALRADAARAAADQADSARAEGRARSRWHGIPISIKDLFDVEGEVTGAGSRIFRDNPPAERDCPVVARLRAAGFVFVGRTNMTEFAYSGVGLNPHHGTPLNPHDREGARIPGGSSSGAAISVTDGMAAAGMGTDTGGSCRIPAALCGLTGYKPTAKRVPLEGVTPLSFSLDSIGSLAPSVGCVAAIDGVISGSGTDVVAERAASGVRVGVIANYVTEDWDAAVAQDFAGALARLSAAGAQIEDVALPELDRLPEIHAKGGLAAAEAYHVHRDHLARDSAAYDPRVASRIAKGAESSAVDYIDLLIARAKMIEAIAEATAALDVLACPTVPTIVPRLAELEDEADYARINLLMLRNPSLANFLDLCSISLPVHAPGAAPVGLMLTGKHGGDEALFRVARAFEAVLAA